MELISPKETKGFDNLEGVISPRIYHGCEDLTQETMSAMVTLSAGHHLRCVLIVRKS
jgi:hypothetical protein